MAAGTETYMGGAVPLYPQNGINLKQQKDSSSTDVLTITASNSSTGDLLNLVRYAGTERFSVEDGGNVVITQGGAGDVGLKILRASTPTASALQITDNAGTARFSISKNYQPILRVRTTIPTTGMVTGELLLLVHGDTPKLAICQSTTTQAVKFVNLKRASLIGALSF